MAMTMTQISLFDPGAYSEAKQVENQLDQLDRLVDDAIAKCHAAGADPKDFLLLLHRRQTANFLHQFSPEQQRTYLIFLIEEFLIPPDEG
jgi:hypothetical protein